MKSIYSDYLAAVSESDEGESTTGEMVAAAILTGIEVWATLTHKIPIEDDGA